MQEKDRTIAAVGCGLAVAALIPVALYQSGLSEHLPDPPGSVFASERITSSRTAHPFGVPDSYLGLASYGTTFALLLLSRNSVAARRLLGAKLVGDAGFASFNAVRQVVLFGRVCSWCTATALATAAVVYGGRAAVADTAKTLRRLV